MLGVLVAQLVSRHSGVADGLPVVVRFPAGRRVRLKTVDASKGNGLGQEKNLHPSELNLDIARDRDIWFPSCTFYSWRFCIAWFF